jgi:hypothetical protein
VDKRKHNKKNSQKMVLLIIDVGGYYGLSGKRGSTATQTPQQQTQNDTRRADSQNSTPSRNGMVL